MFLRFVNRYIKLACVIFALLLLCLPLSGCKSRELTPEKQALVSVGKVGDYDVPYEEFYYLASLYTVEGRSDEEIRDIISENIITNYAILTLCDRLGISVEQKELDSAVQTELDAIIDEEFAGKRKNYINSLTELGMTDHYVRFTLRTDLLYSEAETALASTGELYTEEDEIIEYIKQNFVRTWHFMVADNKGESSEDNIKRANEALEQLRDGKTDMYELIGSALNEDLLIPAGGYAFAKGSKAQEYEDAAFALEIYEYSDVITFKSEIASGEYGDCHYVMQRLPIDDEYIDENFSTLYDAYKSAFVALKLESVKSELTFIPNDYALSLNLKNLPAIDAGTDTGLIIIIAVCVLAAAVIAIGTVIIIKYLSKRKAALKAVKSTRALESKSKKNEE